MSYPLKIEINGADLNLNENTPTRSIVTYVSSWGMRKNLKMPI